MDFLRPVKLWILLTTLTSLAGWTLSAFGQLNRIGYAAFFFVAIIFFLWLRKSAEKKPRVASHPWKKFLRRFRRPLPMAFAVLTILIFLGGCLYPPTNHTAFTYRIPRVLNWLAHGSWFWVHTPDCRINDRACGIEWTATPLLLFLRSDRGLFLLNFIPFLMLPGLFFSVCTRLGVRARAAWHWMWLLPTGYSFLLQAGSAGNDTFPTVYALAAVDFGLRAWKSRRASDVWFSILAAALLNGAKASNLPLLLPCAVLIVPLLPILRRRIVATAFVLVIAAVISFLPTAILNNHYCGDWTGAVIEPADMTMMHEPITGIWGNALQLALDNFVPPVFPIAGWWNQNAPHLFPHAIAAPIEKNFQVGYYWLGELPTEDWAGLGFGVSVLLVVSIIAAFAATSRNKRTRSGCDSLSPPERGEGRGEGISVSDKKASSPQPSPPLGEEREKTAAVSGYAWNKVNALEGLSLPRILRQLVLFTPWIALLAYCVKSGMVTAARLISPYYFLLIPSLILGAGHAQIVRRCWWKIASWLVMLIAFVVLIITPPRPLWPAQTILSAALKAKPGHPLLTRALNVYSVYAIRSDPLAPIRNLLPPDIKVIGFLGTADDIDISLWRPYGTKRVEHILLEDSPAFIRSKGIDWAVVSGLHLHENKITLDEWLTKSGAELIATTNLIQKVSNGPQPWHVVRFK